MSFKGFNLQRVQSSLHFVCCYILNTCTVHVYIVLHSCLDVFDNYMQQDAHEFFNYLLNTIGDLLQGVVMRCPFKEVILIV